MNRVADFPTDERATIADLVRDLGEIPLARIRRYPPPGTATVADVERNKCCELVDRTLVEKAMGLRESFLAMFLGRILGEFVADRDLGMISGPDGTIRFAPDLVRIPDIAFISWDRFPNRQIPEEPVPGVVPNLAIEVLSVGNTPAEMARKRQEFFAAGVNLVWIVDRFTRTVAVYTDETTFATLTEADALDGGAVLPGFTVAVRDIFAELDRHG
jgi:Uma2 family endonuclease